LFTFKYKKLTEFGIKHLFRIKFEFDPKL